MKRRHLLGIHGVEVALARVNEHLDALGLMVLQRKDKSRLAAAITLLRVGCVSKKGRDNLGMTLDAGKVQGCPPVRLALADVDQQSVLLRFEDGMDNVNEAVEGSNLKR
jgi:hypothetical protein